MGADLWNGRGVNWGRIGRAMAIGGVLGLAFGAIGAAAQRLTPEPAEQVQGWEQQVEQQARDCLERLQPVMQALGVQVKMVVSRSEPASAAHYKSTLDVWFVDEHGRVLWVDSLILYMSSARWAETEDVRLFLHGALREALQNWCCNRGSKA